MTTNETATFFAQHFGALLPGETIEIRSIHPHTHQVSRHWFTDANAAAEHVLAWSEHFDCYYSINPRKGEGSSKADVSRILCLWADVDAKHFPSKGDALAAIERLVLRPSVVIDSSGGFQALWYLAQPEGPHMAAALEALMRRLYLAINPALDGVQDISRIFRPPASVNHKPGRGKPRVEIVYADPGRVYRPGDFDAVLPPLPDRQARSVTVPSGDASVEEVRELLRHIDPCLPYDAWVQVLMAVHSVFPDETGYTLVDEWSTEAREANEQRSVQNQPEKWGQFRGEGVTIATLYHYAKEGGWEPTPAFKLVERKRPTLTVPKWEQPLAAIPALTQADRPALLQRVVDYLRPVTVAWREDWADMLALAGLSAMLGHLDFGGIKPNLWLLGISGQSAGKSAAGDVMVELVQKAMALARWPFGSITESSPQGLQQELATEGGATMLYYSEYSGMLQALKHEYMSGTKQMLCDLYDGRAFRRRLKNEVVEAPNPYLTFIGSTTLSQFVSHANIEDFINGYHSRFLFVAPDYLNVTIERRPNGLECKDMANDLVYHLTPIRAVTEVKWLTPFNQKPPAFAALEDELGVNTGEVIRLEDTLGRDDVPPGRVLVRVKKVATLLAALRSVPNVRDGVLLVSDEDVQLARRVVLRGSAYARRLASSLSKSEDSALQDKVMRHMVEHKSLTQRELQRLVKANKRELEPALEVLVDAGDLTVGDEGRSRVYRLAEA